MLKFRLAESPFQFLFGAIPVLNGYTVYKLWTQWTTVYKLWTQWTCLPPYVGHNGHSTTVCNCMDTEQCVS